MPKQHRPRDQGARAVAPSRLGTADRPYWRHPSDRLIVADATRNKTNLSFVVRGPPQSLKRHRYSQRAGGMCNPSKSAQSAFHTVVKEMIGSRSTPVFPEGVSVRVRIVFALKRPVSHFKGKNIGGAVLENALPLARTKQDVDNLAKFVLDALGKLMYENDHQVVSLQVEKVYDNEGIGSTSVWIEKALD